VKTESFESTATTAYGTKLPVALKFGVTVSSYENFAEIVAANDTMSEKEQLDTRNAERKAAAVARARNAAFDAAGIIKPTIENDEQLRIREMIKVLMAAKKTFEEARATAEVVLGIVYIA
jgi:hypothetical protein